MHLKQLVERRDLWSIGIYKLESKLDILRLDTHEPLCLIGQKGFRKGFDYQSTVADPFLFTFGGKLYLFYEVKTDHRRGEIWAQFLSGAGDWVSLGRVLSEDFHLSYPQVFEHHGCIYMIPEAARSGRVLLYSPVHFPTKWELSATLINEPLLDPTVFVGEGDGFLLLGTTKDYELKLYHSTAVSGPFSDTGIVISKDKAVSRCAGSILQIDGAYYRPAQDCSRIYGERIQLLHITNASGLAYCEEPSVADLFVSKPWWMSVGSHHLSTSEFDGSVYVAVDGRRRDHYVNTLLLGILKFRERFIKSPHDRAN